jgi:hypothetical protein
LGFLNSKGLAAFVAFLQDEEKDQEKKEQAAAAGIPLPKTGKVTPANAKRPPPASLRAPAPKKSRKSIDKSACTPTTLQYQEVHEAGIPEAAEDVVTLEDEEDEEEEQQRQGGHE